MSKSKVVYEEYRGLLKIKKDGEYFVIIRSTGEEVDRSKSFDEAYALLYVYKDKNNV